MDKPTIIEVMPETPPAELLWQPMPGKETLELLDRLASVSEEGRGVIREEAGRILGRCIPPVQQEGNCTGLVVGYVQSGKTISFTTVTALARDNGYQMIILIAGTKVPLLNQSRERLLSDLRISAKEPDFRPWRHAPDPQVGHDDHRSIESTLQQWKNPNIPKGKRKTVLITVMKHWSHLQNLIEVLTRIDMRGVPTLIIDDEGDQAGLNTQVRKGGMSTTYEMLYKLKRVVPHHSILQYTATPQAPLLINIADVLSPSFAEVITPGKGYVGGKECFIEKPSIVSTIPSAEIPTKDMPLTQAPRSLLKALRLFLLGAAAHAFLEQSGRRSMMVHPSQRTAPHGDYYVWASRAIQAYQDVFGQPAGHPAQRELLKEFSKEYLELTETVQDIPSFDELVGLLSFVLSNTSVVEFNATKGKTKPIDWSQCEYWVIVGGQALDRGFTVEGLTITYMPRNAGEKNADTLQQRARFFGYKSAYRGYCRVFLESEARQAFEDYVEHEEDVRRQLVSHRGHPLLEWKRDFFLRKTLNPTRRNVIDVDYRRYSLDREWAAPRALHESQEIVVENRKVFSDFLEQVVSIASFREASDRFIDRRGLDSHKNLIAEGVPLKLVQAALLTRLRVREVSDSNLMQALLRVVQWALELNDDETATILKMGNLHPQYRQLSGGKINEIFQGMQPKGAKTDEEIRYAGDRAFYDPDVVTIHLRCFDLGSEKRGTPEHQDVPFFAVRLPERMAKDVLSQPQGGKVQ
jgi:Z1 domain.